MGMRLSCAFATSFSTPEHVAVAERLGYERAWLYDSPALYPDVWMTLAECALRTTRIGLGPGVLVPSLRHPMVTAAAIGHLDHLAPGRVAVGIGSGFTGRVALGQRPMAWASVQAYVGCVRALLAGETTTWQDSRIRMLHAAGFAPERPLRVPFYFGVAGPRAETAARESADGVLSRNVVAGVGECAILTNGTILADGEDPLSDRVIAAAGHSATMRMHAMAERVPRAQLPPAVANWLTTYDDLPVDERHLAMHELHLVGVTDRDRPFLTAEAMRAVAQTPTEWRSFFTRVAADGATEVVYQPAGPNIEAELTRFAELARSPRSH